MTIDLSPWDELLAARGAITWAYIPWTHDEDGGAGLRWRAVRERAGGDGAPPRGSRCAG